MKLRASLDRSVYCKFEFLSAIGKDLPIYEFIIIARACTTLYSP